MPIRTHLDPPPDYQGGGPTGCWEAVYYLDQSRDVCLRLIQSLTPSGSWICYLSDERRRTALSAETERLAASLPAGLIGRLVIPDSAGQPVDYCTVAEGNIAALVEAARRWLAGGG